jgi:hypothetical protein
MPLRIIVRRHVEGVGLQHRCLRIGVICPLTGGLHRGRYDANRWRNVHLIKGPMLPGVRGEQEELDIFGVWMRFAHSCPTRQDHKKLQPTLEQIRPFIVAKHFEPV